MFELFWASKYFLTWQCFIWIFYRHLECNRLGMLFRQIPLSAIQDSRIASAASPHCRGIAHRILLQGDLIMFEYVLCTLLWMLWVPGSWNWRSLGSSMVAPGDLWVCESRHAKCHVPCRHAFNRLGSFPIGLWDDAFLVCGAESNLRPLQKIYDIHALHVHATIIHHILSASERLHAAACSYVKLLSWPLSSNSPSLSTHTRVHWNHVSNTHDGS